MATVQMDTAIRHLCQTVLRKDWADRTDAQLLTSFIDQKEEAAFDAIVRRHGPMVFGVCRRVVGNHHDAEDAFQATFLVLARKASSVRPREKLVNWLHGVALRTAVKAKATISKRRGREKQVTEMPEPQAAQQDQWHDLQPLLDQELNGLPENYRMPILLCDLEGKTIKEATKQLGWPQGTLAGRLARGRKLLARRLANRGVVLSAGSLVSVVSQNVASAGVPTALMSSTVKAAAMIAAGQATVAGVVPAKVAILTEGVIKAMLLSKLKTATVGLLLAALFTGAAGAIYQSQAAAQQKEGPKNKTTANAPAPQDVPPTAADLDRFLNYAVTAEVMEAGKDKTETLVHFPKMTLEPGQRCPPLHIDKTPQSLLAKVVDDEKIKIGPIFEFHVEYEGENKVRLFWSLQLNELETFSDTKIRVMGRSVQAIEFVELHKPVKVVIEKDAAGSPRRWIEITVDDNGAKAILPPPAGPGIRWKEGEK